MMMNAFCVNMMMLKNEVRLKTLYNDKEPAARLAASAYGDFRPNILRI